MNARQQAKKPRLRSLKAHSSKKSEGVRRTIAVDFHGVIAEYNGWKGKGALGLPRKDVIRALHELHAEGWKIAIHTTRGEQELRPYLVHHWIPHDEINRNSDYRTLGVKPVADVYWDDRAFFYSGDARRDISPIRRFRTWCGRK